MYRVIYEGRDNRKQGEQVSSEILAVEIETHRRLTGCPDLLKHGFGESGRQDFICPPPWLLLGSNIHCREGRASSGIREKFKTHQNREKPKSQTLPEQQYFKNFLYK